MAGLLEALTRIGPGEQIWTQIVATPADNNWGEKAEALIKKLSGARVETKKNIFDRIFELPLTILDAIITPPTETHTSKKEEPYNLMMHLTPGEKDEINAIEKKIGKLGFHFKIRLIYLAEKEKFNKPVGLVLYGSYKQFNTLDLNALKPDPKTFTGGIVWFKKMRLNIRKNKLLYRYRFRGHWLEPGFYGKVLNSEELASLWHFPILTVKAPLVKKIEAKKAEPPMSLPIEGIRLKAVPAPITKGVSPPNLPTK